MTRQCQRCGGNHYTAVCPLQLQNIHNDPPSLPPPSPNPSSDSPRLDQAGGSLSDILKERGGRYGDFSRQAEISQQFKGLIESYGDATRLTPLHQEALDMIANKLARILNGDPNYTDSWQDIAGYAQLVVNILEKK